MVEESLRSICVYCGSNAGNRLEYAVAARQLGTIIAGQKVRMVYGGGAVGLMGIVAEAAMAAGGEVIGIIPKSLDRREIANRNLTTLHVVDSMHERKAMMNQLSDGFIALPGGYGTFEELCEMLTWSQLGIHQKPIGLMNVSNYFYPLLAMFDHAVNEAFLHQDHRSMLLHDTDPTSLIAKMRAFTPSTVTKWLNQGEE